MNPLISVCIGAYNRQNFIRECLDSVMAQTYRPIEVIVADNASTDDTREIVRGYPGVRLLERAENSGMCSTTRNMAARAATGDYLAFLDSDDAWYPDKIEKQVRFMEDHPAYPLCHAYGHLMDEHSVVYGIRHENRLPPSGDYFDVLLEHCWITISSVMIRRGLFREAGPFNESLPYGKSGEDYEFFLKVARRYPVGQIDDVLIKYRKSRHSITAGDWRGIPQTIPFYQALLGRDDIWRGRVPSRLIRSRFVSACMENSIYWRDADHGARAAWCAAQALRVAPVSSRAWNQLLRSLVRWVF